MSRSTRHLRNSQHRFLAMAMHAMEGIHKHGDWPFRRQWCRESCERARAKRLALERLGWRLP